MVTTIKIVKKNLNLSKLWEELIAAGFADFGLLMAGFHKLDSEIYNGIYEPNATQQVIATSTGQPDDIAEVGELRLKTAIALSGAEETTLDGVYAAHDFSIKTEEQERVDTDIADLDQLVIDYGNWDTMTQDQKNVVSKRMLRVIVRDYKGEEAKI